jgi:ATP-dependent Clp protease ATP-binding subunit ClpA
LEQVYAVLQAQRDNLKSSRGVDVPDAVLRRLIHYADKYMRNRAFPDKGIDLIQKCVANALVRRSREVDFATAESVAQRMIGIPLDIGSRIEVLRQALTDRNLLSPAYTELLSKRLQVTMRGLDMRMERPNAVLLLTGVAAGQGQSLAEVICGALFESSERLVKIELGSSSDVTHLLGAPPSFIGHGNPLPIHRIKDYPWCVALFEVVDKSHHNVQQVLGQALENGYFVDGQNQKIFLSDAIVILTAPGMERSTSGAIGFQAKQSDSEFMREMVRRQLVPGIANAVDIICEDIVEVCLLHDDSEWLKSALLSRLAEKFKEYGVHLQWDESFLRWLKEKGVAQFTTSEQDRLLDEEVSPVILSSVGDCCGPDRTVVVSVYDNLVSARDGR